MNSSEYNIEKNEAVDLIYFQFKSSQPKQNRKNLTEFTENMNIHIRFNISFK